MYNILLPVLTTTTCINLSVDYNTSAIHANIPPVSIHTMELSPHLLHLLPTPFSFWTLGWNHIWYLNLGYSWSVVPTSYGLDSKFANSPILKGNAWWGLPSSTGCRLALSSSCLILTTLAYSEASAQASYDCVRTISVSFASFASNYL